MVAVTHEGNPEGVQVKVLAPETTDVFEAEEKNRATKPRKSAS